MSDRGITEPNKDDTEAQECLIQCDSVNYHFVVFGKSGTGKSSLCNQLANRDLQDVLKFRVGSGLSTVTVQCQQELAASPDGQLRFTVIDVPGESLDSHTKKFSLEKFVEKLQQHIRDNKELTSNADRRCKTVIIICVRCDARYAAEEFRTYLELKVIWDDDQDFCERLMVAFTHGDKLVGDASDDEDDTESREQPRMPAADGANKTREVGEERGQADKTSGHPEVKQMPDITQQEAKKSEAEENQNVPAEQHDNGTSSSSGAAAKDAEQASGMLEKESAQEEVQGAKLSLEDQKATTEGDRTEIAAEQQQETGGRNTTEDRNTTGDGVDQESLRPGTSTSAALPIDNAERSKETDTKTCNVDADNRAGKLAVKGEESANRAADIEIIRAERILAKKLKATWLQLMRLLSDSRHRYVLFNNKKGHKDERSVLILLQIVQMMELTGVPNPKRGNRAGTGSSSLVRADGGKGEDGWNWRNLFFLCLRNLRSFSKSPVMSYLVWASVVCSIPFIWKKMFVSSPILAADVTTKTAVMVWQEPPYDALQSSAISKPFPQLNVSSYFGYVSYVSYLQAHWGWWIF